MSATELWHFVRSQGLVANEIGAIILGLVLLATGIFLVVDLVKTIREPRRAYDTIMGFVGTLGIGTACLLFAWGLARERYLLRPAAGRYTVGTVVQHKWWRGRQKFIVVYEVAGQPHQTDEACGIADNENVPCPELGTRRYVYFAPEDPTVERVTAVRVPDHITTVPPLGWARLPE